VDRDNRSQASLFVIDKDDPFVAVKILSSKTDTERIPSWLVPVTVRDQPVASAAPSGRGSTIDFGSSVTSPDPPQQSHNVSNRPKTSSGPHRHHSAAARV
jgi:hypothetical protein